MILYQQANGYCYNSDTIFLYDFISKFNPKGDVLDVGSGCGILGLLLGRDFDIKLTQIDIQKNNTFLNDKNAKANNINSTIICADFLECDFEKKFDFIVSNPPFYHTNHILSSNESIRISRYNDFLPIEKFFLKVSTILKRGGRFLFCYDAKQLTQVIATLEKFRLKITDMRFVHTKIDKNSSLVLICARKESKSLLNIWSPLIVFDKLQETKEVKAIYQKSRTYSIKCSF